MTTRADVVACARTLVGTPYQHQGRLPGIALDCIGVPILVARTLGLVSPTFDVNGYGLIPDGRTLMRLATKYMVRRPADASLIPGVVIVAVVGHDPQHFGILGDYRHGGLSIIHAFSVTQTPRVVETRWMPHARLRLVAAFDLPGVTE